MCHNYIFYLVFLFFAVGRPTPGYAQLPNIPGDTTLTYHFHKIAQTEGLSSYGAKRIIQDEYGYVWIGTQDGLNRYDGQKITVYNKSVDPPRQLASNDIWDLVDDTARHLLWVLSYSGLNSIDLTTGQVLSNPPALAQHSRLFPNGWFKSLRLDHHRLWIGGDNPTGLAVYNTDHQAFDSIEPLPLKEGRQAETYKVAKLWPDEYGRIWAFVSNYGIVIYSAASGRILQRHPLKELGLPTDKDNNSFLSIAPVTPGRIALGAHSGLFEIRYDQGHLLLAPFPLHREASLLGRQEILCCARDSHGQLWFSAANRLYRLDLTTGRMTEIKDTDYSNPENWFTSIQSIYFDRFEHLWLGGQKGLAYSTIQPSPFAFWFQSADHTHKINHANFVCTWQDSLICVCAEDGFYTVNMRNRNIRRYSEARFVYAAVLKDHRLLVSSEDSLYVLQQEKLVKVDKVYPDLATLVTENINSLVWCGDSLAIMGSDKENGIFCWRPQQHRVDKINDESHPLSLESGVVNMVYHDHRGRVWVLSDTYFGIFDPARNTLDTFHITDPHTHQPANFYFDVAEAGGLYWLAIYGTGLVALDSTLQVRKIISTPDGLANAGLYKVIPWHDSVLFVTSNNGLARIRLPQCSVVNFFRQDGLHGNGFEESCAYFEEPYIYAGGENGVSRIDPRAICTDPLPPSIRVANIRLQTSTAVRDIGDISSSTLTIPSDVVQANLTLSTFNYTDGARTLLSYRIPELKTQWIPLGTERTINLLGLSPGDYTLLVQAVNANGLVDQRDLSLNIIWLPKWYQALWFKALVLVVLVLLFYVFYRYRISQIRQQQLIRQNISSDLHDDIGSILNTIKIFTHLARKEPAAETWLTRIEDSLAQAAVALRDIIWVLDDSLDTVYEFVARIRHFSTPVTTAREIRLEIVADPELYHQPLSKAEKRNLLLIAKESINNSIKYAACSMITVRIGIENKTFLMRIEDNGMGFDTSQTSDGNGLRNIGHRAAQIHYTATIDSAPGAGTRITLAKC